MLRSLLLTVLSISIPVQASPQGPIIALEVGDQSNGHVRSAFASALRALGDVTVVTSEEEYDVGLQVAVSCGGDCGANSAFAVAYNLTRPIRAGHLLNAYLVTRSDTSSQRLGVERATEMIGHLRGFVQIRVQGVEYAQSGEEVRQEVEALVAELDSQCFESIRLANRVRLTAQRGEYETSEALEERYRDEDWIC